MTTHPVTGRMAVPGKVHHCSVFCPFVVNGSHCGFLESQSLRNFFFFFYIVNFRCQEQMNVWKFSLINKVADLMDIKLLFKFDP